MFVKVSILIFCFLPLFTDNGPHYHNTSLLVYLAEVNQCFNVSLLEYNNFEAGEGKTVLDTHFAHISHKIVRWVRVGNNLENGEQLSNLVSVSCVYHLMQFFIRIIFLFIYFFCICCGAILSLVQILFSFV